MNMNDSNLFFSTTETLRPKSENKRAKGREKKTEKEKANILALALQDQVGPREQDDPSKGPQL